VDGIGHEESRVFRAAARLSSAVDDLDYGLAHCFPVSRSATTGVRHDSASAQDGWSGATQHDDMEIPIYSFSVTFEST